MIQFGCRQLSCLGWNGKSWLYCGCLKCEDQLAVFDLVNMRGKYLIFFSVDMPRSELHFRISFAVVNHLNLCKESQHIEY